MSAVQKAFEQQWDFFRAGETVYEGKVPRVCWDLDLLSTALHARNQHFYHDIETGKKLDRNVGELIALIHSEVSEMLEGVRKGLPDEKLPQFTNEEVEAADVLIRMFDYCGYRKLRIGEAFWAKLEFNRTRQDHTNEARRAAGGKKF